MLTLLLEKMLLEEDFMIHTMNDCNNVVNEFKLTDEESYKLLGIRDKLDSFFCLSDNTTRNDFFININNNKELRSHFIEYANEKCTYAFANARSEEISVVAVVWCAGGQ